MSAAGALIDEARATTIPLSVIFSGRPWVLPVFCEARCHLVEARDVLPPGRGASELTLGVQWRNGQFHGLIIRPTCRCRRQPPGLHPFTAA
jgi:hypothetical protein